MPTPLPAGWKLVPIEPTDEMETAAENDYEQRGETFPDWKAKYRAMLAAAPTPPASAQDDAKDVEAAARAIWAIRREHEDRCDMELEDMGAHHPVWEEARVAVAAITAKVGAPATGDARDAERWRFIRRKLCLTGNGDGTCGMHAINLPASIPGWPEPGAAVAEFCDAAIDTAIASQQQEG